MKDDLPQSHRDTERLKATSALGLRGLSPCLRASVALWLTSYDNDTKQNQQDRFGLLRRARHFGHASLA